MTMEITTVASFIEYWTSVRERTRRIAACIPPDRIEWSPRAGKFTFGDLLRHLGALQSEMFAENVAGRPSRYQGCGRELADGLPAIMAFLDRMNEESIAIFRTLGPDQLRQKCRTPAGVEITTWKWLRAMVEHEIHHRGQMYLMLNLIEVATPPLFGLTSEQVRDRSV
jgi:uncharacterized damage-inducible protein DinB